MRELIGNEEERKIKNNVNIIGKSTLYRMMTPPIFTDDVHIEGGKLK